MPLRAEADADQRGTPAPVPPGGLKDWADNLLAYAWMSLAKLLKDQQERIDGLNASEIDAQARAAHAAQKADEAEAAANQRKAAIRQEIEGAEAAKTKRVADLRDELERVESVSKQDIARWSEANRKAKEDFDREQASRQREKVRLNAEIATLNKELDALHEKTRR